MTLENYNYMRELAEKKIRLDQRGEFEGRKITIKDNVINHSDGSAYVELGNTKVIAGVKVLNGTPFPDRPKEGALVVNFEASELASNYNDDRINYSIEIGRVTDRGIRESNLIDLTKLVIEEGKTVSFVYVDIVCLNNEGNLFDAANIAALRAILNAKYKVEGKEETFTLPLDRSKLAVSHTFTKINGTLFFDPSAEEEKVADARFTIGLSEKINSLQKGGDGVFTPEEIDFCVEKAIELRKERFKTLMENIGN